MGVDEKEKEEYEEDLDPTRNDKKWKETLHIIEQCAIHHVNRHVRAASIGLLERLVHSAAASVTTNNNTNNHNNSNANNNSNNNNNDEQQDNEEQQQFQTIHMLTEPTSLLRQVTMNVLEKTLDDNWSQVRMSASVLCRTFLLSLRLYLECYDTMYSILGSDYDEDDDYFDENNNNNDNNDNDNNNNNNN